MLKVDKMADLCSSCLKILNYNRKGSVKKTALDGNRVSSRYLRNKSYALGGKIMRFIFMAAEG